MTVTEAAPTSVITFDRVGRAYGVIRRRCQQVLEEVGCGYDRELISAVTVKMFLSTMRRLTSGNLDDFIMNLEALVEQNEGDTNESRQ